MTYYCVNSCVTEPHAYNDQRFLKPMCVFTLKNTLTTSVSVHVCLCVFRKVCETNTRCSQWFPWRTGMREGTEKHSHFCSSTSLWPDFFSVAMWRCCHDLNNTTFQRMKQFTEVQETVSKYSKKGGRKLLCIWFIPWQGSSSKKQPSQLSSSIQQWVQTETQSGREQLDVASCVCWGLPPTRPVQTKTSLKSQSLLDLLIQD